MAKPFFRITMPMYKGGWTVEVTEENGHLKLLKSKRLRNGKGGTDLETESYIYITEEIVLELARRLQMRHDLKALEAKVLLMRQQLGLAEGK